MNIKVNGKDKSVEDSISLNQFVKDNDFPEAATAIALNQKLCLKKDWEQTLLKEGDTLTIITAAFGG